MPGMMHTPTLSPARLARSAGVGIWDLFTVPDNSSSGNSTGSQYTHGLTGVTLGLDGKLLTGLGLTLLILAVGLLLMRILQRFSAHLRRVSAMGANKVQQNYYTYDKVQWWPTVKKYLAYAPLGTKRHNREWQLSKASNYGVIPTRANTILITLYVIINFIYIAILDYNSPAVFAELRGRSGVLATANMILLVLMAGRNNPLIPLLQISFNSFNLFHRWLGRIVVVESFIHGLAWRAASLRASTAHDTWVSISQDPFLVVGGIATTTMIVILFQSLSPLRHAFYETFLHLHQLLALTTVIGVYLHLEIAHLPALPYIRAVVALWAADRGLRTFRLLYLNLSRRNGSTHVLVEALAAEACRVTFYLPRHITIRPGSHVYAYLPKVSLWMSHPFSVAWTNIESEPPTGWTPTELKNLKPAKTSDKFVDVSLKTPSPRSLESQFPRELPSRPLADAPTSVSLIVAARSGMTRKLYDMAMKSENKQLRMSGYLEGTYAGHDSMASYGTVILFAGGAGITHHLVQVRHLIAAANAQTVATRKIVLVWSVRDVEMLSWVRPWMDEILLMENRKEILKVLLFVSRPKKGSHLKSPSSGVRLITGRCDPNKVLDEELQERVGATAVAMCGPGAFGDEVRHAVRERLHVGVVDYLEEEFTW